MAELEELDELASALGQAPRTGKGAPDVLGEHERSLRKSERNRLLGAASSVQPKPAAILAAVYLPEFIVLSVASLVGDVLDLSRATGRYSVRHH